MRYCQLVQLVLFFLLGNVRVSEGGLSALRSLQDGTNETEVPSDVSGEGGDADDIGDAQNGTALDEKPSDQAETETTAIPEKNENESANTTSTEENQAPTTTESPEVEVKETEKPEETGSTGTPAGTEPENPEESAVTEPENPEEGTPAPTGEDGFGGDDGYGDEAEEEMEEEWFEPEEQGTNAPYIPPTGDDPFAKEPDESEWLNKDQWKQETPEEMMHDTNVIIAVTCSVLFGFFLAICSAQQLINNPDGCCSSMCRCCTKFFCFFFKILCFPCRMCCGNKDRRTHDLMVGSSDSYTHDLELT